MGSYPYKAQPNTWAIDGSLLEAGGKLHLLRLAGIYPECQDSSHVEPLDRHGQSHPADCFQF